MTETNWDLYTAHREKVTRLTLHALSYHPFGRVCVLGAGNCNDLNLTEIARKAAEIHLVDFDDVALDRAQARANAQMGDCSADAATLLTHRGVDLTGLSSYLLGDDVSSAESIVERALEGPKIGIGQPFDVVISAGLLTQLISLPVDALGEGNASLNSVIIAVRTAHLRLMRTLLECGGHGILVTDVVSSDTIPGLSEATHETLPRC
jgi:hypothetical protein